MYERYAPQLAIFGNHPVINVAWEFQEKKKRKRPEEAAGNLEKDLVGVERDLRSRKEAATVVGAEVVGRWKKQ